MDSFFVLGGDNLSFKAKTVPKVTPLKSHDPPNRLAYAENGPILNGGTFGVAELSDDWEIRKTQIGFLDHKPWWLDSSSAKNRFYYCFGDEDEPPEVLAVDKHSPHFMNFCGISYKSRVFSLF